MAYTPTPARFVLAGFAEKRRPELAYGTSEQLYGYCTCGQGGADESPQYAGGG